VTLLVSVENFTISIPNRDVTDVSNLRHVVLSDIFTTELPRRIDGTRSDPDGVFSAVDTVGCGGFD